MVPNKKGESNRVQKRYNLRMPFPLYEWLKVEAKKQSRSLCGQILFILTNEMDNKKATDLTDQSASVASLNRYFKEKENSYE